MKKFTKIEGDTLAMKRKPLENTPQMNQIGRLYLDIEMVLLRKLVVLKEKIASLVLYQLERVWLVLQ